jgi:hypothetical protein
MVLHKVITNFVSTMQVISEAINTKRAEMAKKYAGNPTNLGSESSQKSQQQYTTKCNINI